MLTGEQSIIFVLFTVGGGIIVAVTFTAATVFEGVVLTAPFLGLVSLLAWQQYLLLTPTTTRRRPTGNNSDHHHKTTSTISTISFPTSHSNADHHHYHDSNVISRASWRIWLPPILELTLCLPPSIYVTNPMVAVGTYSLAFMGAFSMLDIALRHHGYYHHWSYGQRLGRCVLIFDVANTQVPCISSSSSSATRAATPTTSATRIATKKMHNATNKKNSKAVGVSSTSNQQTSSSSMLFHHIQAFIILRYRAAVQGLVEFCVPAAIFAALHFWTFYQSDTQRYVLRRVLLFFFLQLQLLLPSPLSLILFASSSLSLSGATIIDREKLLVVIAEQLLPRMEMVIDVASMGLQIIAFLHMVDGIYQLSIALLFGGRILSPKNMNFPICSRSLREFWGVRWNRWVSRVFRHSIYNLILSSSSTSTTDHQEEEDKGKGKKEKKKPSLFRMACASFLVFFFSAVLHWGMGFGMKASWDKMNGVFLFFLLHWGLVVLETVVVHILFRDYQHDACGNGAGKDHPQQRAGKKPQEESSFRTFHDDQSQDQKFPNHGQQHHQRHPHHHLPLYRAWEKSVVLREVIPRLWLWTVLLSTAVLIAGPFLERK